MTDMLDGILAFVVVGLLTVAVAYQMRVRVHFEDRPFLTKVFFWTILIRYSLAVVLNIFVTDSAFAATFWGDSHTYDLGGYEMSLKWSGEPITTVYMSTAVSGYGWVYFVGAIYYVFGRNSLLVQLVNGLIGGITVLVIYAIAVRLFDRAAARWAALFMAFFPQMVFWSTGMYKDPATLLCIAVAMYAVVGLRERLSPSMVTFFVVSLLALFALRFYIAYFVLFATLATLVFGQRRSPVRVAVTYTLLGAVLYGVITIGVRRETLERQATYLTLERLQTTREDQATWGRSGFGQEYDVSTPGGALAALPIGLLYLIFAPFPWAAAGLRQALVVPETLVWYALMPAFVRGVRVAVKRNLSAIMPIAVFAVSLTVAYALMQGNVGTAYRQRTQVTMFFFIFMGVGLVERRRRRGALEMPVEHAVREVRP